MRDLLCTALCAAVAAQMNGCTGPQGQNTCFCGTPGTGPKGGPGVICGAGAVPCPSGLDKPCYVTPGNKCYSGECLPTPAPAPTPKPPPAVPTPPPGSHNNTYCGTSYADANTRCHARCPDAQDDECKAFAGEKCFAVASCGGPAPAPPTPAPAGGTSYCGTGFADANTRCHAACPGGTDDECKAFAGEKCFGKCTGCAPTPAPGPPTPPAPSPPVPPSPPSPHKRVSGLWVFLGDKGLDDCGALPASIATDFNTLSLGFLDPVLVAQGGGAAVGAVKDLLTVTTWAQAKGMHVTWSIGGNTFAALGHWKTALANGGAARMAAEMGALANTHNVGFELDCEDPTDYSADYNQVIAGYRAVVAKGDPVKTLTLNVAGSSYRGDSSGYLGWIGKVAKDPANLATLDRVTVMVGLNVTSDAAWRKFWVPSIAAYGAGRTLLSRKIDTPRCGVADVGTTASYVVSAGLAGMFTWGVAACHTKCIDCLSQQGWGAAQVAGQCQGLEAASKLVMT